MTFAEWSAAFAAAGMTCSEETHLVTGVRQGVAVRLVPENAAVELYLNVAEKLQPKLIPALAAFGDVTVAPLSGTGLVLTCPSLVGQTGEQWLAFTDTAVSAAVALAQDSFTDKFEKDTEPFIAYLRGFAGAFVGAIVGMIPWLLCEIFLGWEFWLLGSAVAVASFFGYRYLWGAHSTRFAFVSIAVSCVLAMLLCEAVYTVWVVMDLSPALQTIGEAIVFIYENYGLAGFFSDALFGLIACGVGVFFLRGQIQVYTHESNFLRRGRRK